MRTPHTLPSDGKTQGWMHVGAVLIGLASLTLLATAFGARFYSNSRSSALLTLVLVALVVATALHARFLILAGREQRYTANILHATEREYQAVFASAIDGILILNDEGICLDANPAVLKLLKIERCRLLGQSIKEFLGNEADFKSDWNQFLDRTYAHCETRIRAGDGENMLVEYTAKANFLPGRHVAVLRDISQRKQAESALRESEERFQQMANNIQEIFWMLDAESKKVIYVNQAYEAITGRACESLQQDPKSYEEVIHPEDRVRVLSRLNESVQTGQFDEEFRIVRPDNMTHWVWVHGSPVRDSGGIVRSLVGTAQDVTARKAAEEQMARNLDIAEAARAEAEAFRKTSLALTQNLSMDYVLDTLLHSLLKLVPCESAQVILVEADTRLFLAREIANSEPDRRVPESPATLDAQDSPFLKQALTTKDSLLISDTTQEAQWVKFNGFSHLHSWLCVPLVASQEILGLLSLGDTHAETFTREHLRLAESLAIPAAVAIQNARLYERAEIYGTELEHRLADLEMIQRALRLSEEVRTLSEERFTKVFRSSPISFSIATLEEGRFVDVNDAFEKRYGYSREQLIGHTVSEADLWDDPSERQQVINEIRQHGRVQNRFLRLRRSSGEAIDTIVSMEAVELDGTECLLTVSHDLPTQAEVGTPLARRSATTH